MTEEYDEDAGEEQQDLDAQLDQQQDGGGDAAPSAEDLKREQAVSSKGCAVWRGYSSFPSA